MHDSVLAWLRMVIHTLDIADVGKVLEVGSLDVNGSARQFFTGQYIGIDRQPGRGVDLIATGHQIPYPREYFDVVVCTETLEHDEMFWKTLAEIGRVLRTGGYLLLTLRGNGYEIHRYPKDYWRFLPDSKEHLLQIAGCEPVLMEDDEPPGLLLAGRKL